MSGYSCSMAANVDEAVEALKQGIFELAICDIEMPGLSGLDLLNHVRREYPDIAVMMMTGIDAPERATIALEAGAYSYLVKPFEPNELLINIHSSLRRRRLELEHEREKKSLEDRVQEKTESLNAMMYELDASHAFLRSTVDALTTGIAIIDEAGEIITSNRVWQDSDTSGGLMGKSCGEGSNYLLQLESNPANKEVLFISMGIRSVISNDQNSFTCGYRCQSSEQVLWYTVRVTKFGEGLRRRFVIALENVTEQKLLEMHLVQALKLESVGQLAAGVAHEINTPMQYLGDNLDFVKNKLIRLEPLLNNFANFLEVAEQSDWECDLLTTMRADLNRLKAKSFLQQVSEAIDDCQDGVRHVSRIVRAMKELAHPGQDEKTLTDINRTLESTIAVSTNEWKYVAEVQTNLDASLPLITALPGELSQVFLNILVNAGHAIGDTNGNGATGKGTITVSSRCTDKYVEVSIANSGSWIPDEIKQRIFDPFFTTKAIGKGTGQGLAIAHSVVVQKHGGKLWCDSSPGMGTTFFIQLPIESLQDHADHELEPALLCK